ncbi:MAG: hypothetical protein AAGM36_08490 [Cyanobacteria bacterium J06597_1]
MKPTPLGTNIRNFQQLMETPYLHGQALLWGGKMLQLRINKLVYRKDTNSEWQEKEQRRWAIAIRHHSSTSQPFCYNGG